MHFLNVSGKILRLRANGFLTGTMLTR